MCAIKHIVPELSDVIKHIDASHWTSTSKNKPLLDKLRVRTKLVVTTYSEGNFVRTRSLSKILFVTHTFSIQNTSKNKPLFVTNRTKSMGYK